PENWKEQLDRISDLNKDKEELTKKKNSLKDEIEARNRQINKRAGKNHQLNQDLITANQTISDLEKERDDLTSQRDNRPNITILEHGELTQKINNLTNQI